MIVFLKSVLNCLKLMSHSRLLFWQMLSIVLTDTFWDRQAPRSVFSTSKTGWSLQFEAIIAFEGNSVSNIIYNLFFNNFAIFYIEQ